jgi:hypothetical protein
MITMALSNGGRHHHSTGKFEYRAARERWRLKKQAKDPAKRFPASGVGHSKFYG